MAVSMDDVPPEILVKIFNYLERLSQLRLRRVSDEWNVILRSPAVLAQAKLDVNILDEITRGSAGKQVLIIRSKMVPGEVQRVILTSAQESQCNESAELIGWYHGSYALSMFSLGEALFYQLRVPAYPSSFPHLNEVIFSDVAVAFPSLEIVSGLGSGQKMTFAFRDVTVIHIATTRRTVGFSAHLHSGTWTIPPGLAERAAQLWSLLSSRCDALCEREWKVIDKFLDRLEPSVYNHVLTMETIQRLLAPVARYDPVLTDVVLVDEAANHVMNRNLRCLQRATARELFRLATALQLH